MALSPTSSRGSSGGGGNTLLSTTTLSSPGTFDIQGIVATYTDLLLVLYVRGTAAANVDNALMRFNNDSTAGHYSSQLIQGNIATASAAAGIANTSNTVGPIPSTNADAGQFSAIQIVVFNYASTSNNKAWSGVLYEDSGAAGSPRCAATGGTFAVSANAISRVQVFGNTTANLATGSQLRIYGVT